MIAFAFRLVLAAMLGFWLLAQAGVTESRTLLQVLFMLAAASGSLYLGLGFVARLAARLVARVSGLLINLFGINSRYVLDPWRGTRTRRCGRLPG